MKTFALILFLTIMGCKNPVSISQEKQEVPRLEVTRSEELQKEIDDLLAEDKKNKLLELEYLEQIRIAQENNDRESFEFFFQEYVKVERLDIPEELKKEPNYFQGGLKVKY